MPAVASTTEVTLFLPSAKVQSSVQEAFTFSYTVLLQKKIVKMQFFGGGHAVDTGFLLNSQSIDSILYLHSTSST